LEEACDDGAAARALKPIFSMLSNFLLGLYRESFSELAVHWYHDQNPKLVCKHYEYSNICSTHFYNDKWCKFSKDVARAYGKSFFKLINAMNKIICQKKIYSTISQHNLNKPIRTKQIAKFENGYIYYTMILA
jgi:hypothetical protein